MGSRILDGVIIAAVGPAHRSGAADHTVMVWLSVTGGTLATVVKFTVEGRIRGEGVPDVWAILVAEHTFSAGELTALCAYETVAGKPVDDIRVNVGTLTQGTGVTKVYAEYKSELN